MFIVAFFIFMLSAVMMSVVILSVIMLIVVMLIIVMLSVVMLSVVMLSVMGPFYKLPAREKKSFTTPGCFHSVATAGRRCRLCSCLARQD